MNQKFTHLHVHSHYSLLDGLPKIDQLLDCVTELGMDSVALTDHGALYGAIEFYQKAIERKIKPILGCEIYLAYEGMLQKRPNIDGKRYHLILLVKNEEGYKNLVKLITKANLQGFYYKPRVDLELLKELSSGLICLSGCLQGKISKLILAKKNKEAENVSLQFQEIFGKENFYLELQNHPNIPEQKILNEALISLSKKLKIPLVATHDVHYLKPEDAKAQDILMLINTGADPNDPERLTMKSDDFSMKSQEEMTKLFKDLPEAIENTQKITESCNFNFQFGKTQLPYFKVPEGKTGDDYLRELCYQGIEKRKMKNKKEIAERLEHELSIIQKTGFAHYFLIVQDFVNWAKEKRIIVGPGRGSVAGSLVAYLLSITNVDPLKYNLLFERFLTESRISFPDIDLDFADARRDEVIDYVAQKYGREKVAQIITFGTMAARAVVRDVGRALGHSYSFCDQIAKTIPMQFTLNETLEKVKEFRTLYETDSRARELIDFSKKLEGVARHASTHACGVVISSENLENITPLQHPTQDDTAIVTQYEMGAIEKLGMLKMDFLGLKNLTTIEDTLSRIYKVRNIKLDIENIPLNDKKAYKLLQNGDSTGLFQLESSGMKRYLKELKPTEFEDIVALIALYRPGPMELIPDYIKGKHKKKKVEYLHPDLKPILESTYGICIFQEQLMQIAQKLAGFSLADADVLRKAVGKKIKPLLIAQKEKAMKGMEKNGIKKEVAQRIWEWILPFARYGFNRCISGETKIIDAETGKLVRVKDLHKNSLPALKTPSLGENLTIKREKVLDVFTNGIKPISEVQTRSGRKIRVTMNHPFFTPSGWRKLEEIQLGERIATPRFIPEPETPMKIPYRKLVLLGYLLAEGNFCHPQGFYFYSSSKEEIKDYLNALEKFGNTIGKIDYSKPAIAVYSKRKDIKKPSEAVGWINSLGLRNKKATEKFFPDIVFRLSNNQLAVLIGKMFQGDGCVNLKRKHPQLFYTTSSLSIVEQLQHLLLRLGILSTIHKKNFRYRNTVKIGYTLTINRYDNIQKFIDSLGKHLLSDKQAVLSRIKATHPIINGSVKIWGARGSKDTIPTELIRDTMRQHIQERNLTFSAVSREGGFSNRLFQQDPRKIGYLRETVEIISQTIKSPELKLHANSDIFWDEIVSITPQGKEQTYDLTVEGSHNFIANNIFVHNSHSTAYAAIAYQTAYLKANYPIEFMAALLTSEKADVERIGFLIGECQRMEIQILPPDINESFRNFSVVPKENKIRFGLLAIKNVGHNVVTAIVQERKERGPFKLIFDFVSRIESKDLNKKSLESLIKAGCFDRLEERNKLLFNLEKLLEWNKDSQRIKNQGQKSLFREGDDFQINSNFALTETKPATKTEKLNWEKELLGLYVTSHPLEDFRGVFAKKVWPISKISADLSQRIIKIGGIILKIKKIITKTGRPMLFLSLEDLTDKVEVVAFPGVVEKNPTVFQENKIVLISGRVDNREGIPKVICEEIEEIITTD